MAIDIELEIFYRLQRANLPVGMPLSGEDLIQFEGILEDIQSLLSESENFTDQNQRDFLGFLLKARNWKFFFKSLDRFYNRNQSFAWDLLLTGLLQSKVELSETQIDGLVQGIEKQGAVRLACNSPGAVKNLLGTESWLFQARFDIDRRASKLKAEGLDLLETLRSQNMMQKEKETLEKFRKQFPRDPEIAALYHQFQQRFAFELLESKLRMRRRQGPELIETTSPEEQEFLHFLLGESRTHIQSDQDAVNIALMFYFMEGYQEALVCLRSYCDVRESQSLSRIWLEAELLLKCGLYLELLALLDWIEILLVKDGETTFAVLFLRAKAMKELGQKHLAIEMMEALVSARPDYRSAQWILSDWRDS